MQEAQTAFFQIVSDYVNLRYLNHDEKSHHIEKYLFFNGIKSLLEKNEWFDNKFS